MKMRFFWIIGLGMVLAAGNSLSAAEPGADKREMLSTHETVAQFDGLKFHRCLGRTSLCPDDCGHSGDMANFAVLKYLAYQKPGKYGDPQQTRYQFMIQDNKKNPKVPAELRDKVTALKNGDFVLLSWQHDYVTKNRSSFPERTVTKLEKITREEADKLTGGLDKLPRKKEPAEGGPRPFAR